MHLMSNPYFGDWSKITRNFSPNKNYKNKNAFKSLEKFFTISFIPSLFLCFFLDHTVRMERTKWPSAVIIWRTQFNRIQFSPYSFKFSLLASIVCCAISACDAPSMYLFEGILSCRYTNSCILKNGDGYNELCYVIHLCRWLECVCVWRIVCCFSRNLARKFNAPAIVGYYL